MSERLDTLTKSVYDLIFNIVDAEEDYTGEDAGRVADKVEKTFRKEMLQALYNNVAQNDIHCPRCGWNDALENDRCYNCGE